METKSNLFSFINTKSWKNFILSIPKFFKNKGQTFSLSIYLSISLHFIILAILFFPMKPSSSSGEDIERINYKTLSQTMFYAKKKISSKYFTDPQAMDTLGDEIIEILKNVRISGSELEKKDLSDLLKNIVDEYFREKTQKAQSNENDKINLKDILDILREQGGLNIASGDKIFPSNLSQEEIKLNILPRERSNELEYIKKLREFTKNYIVVDQQVKITTHEGISYVPKSYFFRKSPYEKILAQGANLFYIIDGFPLLKEKPLAATRSSDKSEFSFSPKDGKEFKVVFFNEQTSSKKKSFSKMDVFEVSEKQINQILDKLMYLPEMEQLEEFRKEYLEKFNPDQGDLALLTRRFLSNNLSNVIIVISFVSAAFDYLEELYFNKGFDYKIQDFLEQNPKGKVGEELLFYLASHLGFERRALFYLFNANDIAVRFLSKRYFENEIFNKRTKCYIITEIYDDIINKLNKRGYHSLEEILIKYKEEEEKIYNLIIETKGMDKNRGLFALGRLHWSFGRHDLALENWNKIDNSYSSKAFQKIKKVPSLYFDRQKIIKKIDDLLELYSQEGAEDLLLRLVKYGKWDNR